MLTQMGIDACVNADMFCWDVAYKKSSSKPSTSCTQTYEETKPALKLCMYSNHHTIQMHYPHVGCCVYCMAQNKNISFCNQLGVVLFFSRMMVSKTPQRIVEFLKKRDELKGHPDLNTLFQGLIGMY